MNIPRPSFTTTPSSDTKEHACQLIHVDTPRCSRCFRYCVPYEKQQVVCSCGTSLENYYCTCHFLDPYQLSMWDA